MKATPADEDLERMIRLAHGLGLKVMLKPHIDLVRKWWNRPRIGTAFVGHPALWDAWFASYRTFIFHYAEIAEAEGVEQLAVGTELVGTTGQVERWRYVVAGVRDRFSGTLTYASLIDGEEMAIRWWDAIDLIGIDVYWPLTEEADPTVEELKGSWVPRIEQMAGLSEAWDGKPILFTEIGYRSLNGGNQNLWAPWMLDRPLDLQEQADCYVAAFESVWDEPWSPGLLVGLERQPGCEWPPGRRLHAVREAGRGGPAGLVRRLTRSLRSRARGGRRGARRGSPPAPRARRTAQRGEGSAGALPRRRRRA